MNREAPEPKGLHADLAAALPDLPRWVAPRGLLLERRCEVLLGAEGRRGAGYLVVERDGVEAFGVDRPVASLVNQLADLGRPTGRILVPIESAEPWRRLLPGWQEQPAVLHVHPMPASLPKPTHVTRFLALQDLQNLDQLPPEIADEVRRSLARGPVSAAFVDERPSRSAGQPSRPRPGSTCRSTRWRSIAARASRPPPRVT